MRLRLILKLFFFCFLLHTSLFAADHPFSIETDSSKTDTPLFVPTKSSWGAVLRSAIVPGWGQFYNESYWKIPVFLGIGGWFTYNYIWNDDKYEENRLGYINSGNIIDKSQRDFYRDQRDEFAIYLGLTYFAMLVDAYVDAELFDFSVTEDDIVKTKQYKLKFKFLF